jgi:hypothetical protein
MRADALIGVALTDDSKSTKKEDAEIPLPLDSLLLHLCPALCKDVDIQYSSAVIFTIEIDFCFYDSGYSPILHLTHNPHIG